MPFAGVACFDSLEVASGSEGGDGEERRFVAEVLAEGSSLH